MLNKMDIGFTHIRNKMRNKIDKEVLELCNAINSWPDLYTTHSCCGHGTDTFKIWFDFTDKKSLQEFSKWIHDFDTFYIEYWHGDFILTSYNMGKQAYKDSRELAQWIKGDN